MKQPEPVRPPIEKSHRTPEGKFIPRTKQTAELYRLEQIRSETLMNATAELQSVLKLDDRLREALPEALLRLLISVDPKAAYLAAQAFIVRVDAHLTMGEIARTRK